MANQPILVEWGGEQTVTSPGQKDARKSWERVEDPRPPDGETSEPDKVLDIKRWEVHEGPFRGFNSPPGRF